MLDAALLGLWVKTPITQTSVASAILGFISMLTVVLLEVVEHPKSAKPSTVVSIFLLCTITCEGVQIRTLFLRGYVPQIARLPARTAIKEEDKAFLSQRTDPQKRRIIGRLLVPLHVRDADLQLQGHRGQFGIRRLVLQTLLDGIAERKRKRPPPKAAVLFAVR